MVRGAQTRRAGPNDGNALATFLCRLLKPEALLDGIVADVLLDGVDPDVVLHLVAVAAVLTGRRTHASHLRGKRIGAGHALERVLLPFHTLGGLLEATHDLQPATDVLPRGAATLARWCALHIGRAAMRVVGVEDHVLEARPLVVAVVELAQRMVGFAVGLAPGTGHVVLSSAHCLAPSTRASPTSWCKLSI